VSVKSHHLREFRAEFHIHTVLSPCASVEMIPPLIIEEALEKKINLISITDHNAIDNVPAVIEAAQGTDITVLSGIELQTREEVHSLCLFDQFDQLLNFYNAIEDTFPKINNNPDLFGEQFIVNADGEFIRREERLLITSSNLTLKLAWQEVNRFNGLMIPAHVNRTLFGLLPVLGFIPHDIPLEVLEISKHLSVVEAVNRYPELLNYHLIQGGDAHFLEEILGINVFVISSPCIAEIKLALRGQCNRIYHRLKS